MITPATGTCPLCSVTVHGVLLDGKFLPTRGLQHLTTCQHYIYERAGVISPSFPIYETAMTRFKPKMTPVARTLALGLALGVLIGASIGVWFGWVLTHGCGP